jgi:hypothetical protein
MYEETLIFFFISVHCRTPLSRLQLMQCMVVPFSSFTIHIFSVTLCYWCLKTKSYKNPILQDKKASTLSPLHSIPP